MEHKSKRTAVFAVVGIAVIILLVVAVIAATWPGEEDYSITFCDAVETLDAAVDNSEGAYDAAERFYGTVTAGLIYVLPDPLKTAARALLEVIDLILETPRALASLLFDELDPLIDFAAETCKA